MILKGSQRGSAGQLARHLMNPVDNDHVTMHELRGFVSDDLAGAFKEVKAISLGTRCTQFLFSLSLNPPESASGNLPTEAFEAAIEAIEEKLGLSGQPRAIVFHEKAGRRHAHCVWSRIDAARMRAINLPHFKTKLQDIARELYRTHEWEMPAGLQDRKWADPLNYTQGEGWQAKRAKVDPQTLKALFQRCWQQSDSKLAFAHALREQGFVLAKGDRRGFVIVDASGEVYSLSRWLGIKAKDVRARLGEPDELPSVEQAHTIFQQELDNDQQAKIEAVKADLKIQLAALEQKRQTLFFEQREERQQLQHKQQQRRLTAFRQPREPVPNGLKAVWMKLSGQYLSGKEQVRQIQQQLAELTIQDKQEQQALIRQQLKARRRLQQDYLRLALQHDTQTKLLWKETGALLPRFETNDENQTGRENNRGGISPPLRLHPAIDPNQPLILPEDEEALSLKQKVRRSPETILSVITDKQETFTRNAIVRGLANYIEAPLALNLAIEQVLQSKELVRIEDSGDDGYDSEISAATPAYPSASIRYTTQELQQLNTRLQDQAKVLTGQTSFKVAPRLIRSAIAEQNQKLQQTVGANLSEEQVTAIQHILAPQQLANVVGFAGAGKSTLLAAAHSAWEKQGYRVIGAALSGKAADGLEQSSGITSRTLASLEYSWKQGYNPLQATDVIVIDEAGMVGSRQMARLIDKIKQAGAKLVLVGDPEQLQPIEAGTPFNTIVEQTGCAQLTEIRRQKRGWQREASKLLATQQTEKALQAYEDKGHVTCTEDNASAIAELVDAYMRDIHEQSDQSTRLALAHRRKDMHLINQTIRAARQLAGELWDEQHFKTLHGSRAFPTGDRILLTKNDRELGLRNGMLGTVEKVTETRLTIKLDSEDKAKPRRITIDPHSYKALDHGYATTIHKSQGATVDSAFVLASTTMDRHLAYVALTRHKASVKVYMDGKTRNKLMRSQRQDLERSHHQNYHTHPSHHGPKRSR